jgi:hypothetical protein
MTPCEVLGIPPTSSLLDVQLAWAEIEQRLQLEHGTDSEEYRRPVQAYRLLLASLAPPRVARPAWEALPRPLRLVILGLHTVQAIHRIYTVPAAFGGLGLLVVLVAKPPAAEFRLRAVAFLAGVAVFVLAGWCGIWARLGGLLLRWYTGHLGSRYQEVLDAWIKAKTGWAPLWALLLILVRSSAAVHKGGPLVGALAGVFAFVLLIAVWAVVKAAVLVACVGGIWVFLTV